MDEDLFELILQIGTYNGEVCYESFDDMEKDAGGGRQVGKREFEWVCSNYDGNTLFFDDEITAWTELPEPTMEEGKHEVHRNIPIEENA